MRARGFQPLVSGSSGTVFGEVVFTPILRVILILLRREELFFFTVDTDMVYL